MDSSLGHNFLSSSVEQTIAIAKEFAQRLQPNDCVVIIQGGLGVGKTHFTKGLGSLFRYQTRASAVANLCGGA